MYGHKYDSIVQLDAIQKTTDLKATSSTFYESLTSGSFSCSASHSFYLWTRNALKTRQTQSTNIIINQIVN